MALCLYKKAKDFKFAHAIIMVIWCFLQNKSSMVYFLQVKNLEQKYCNFPIL